MPVCSRCGSSERRPAGKGCAPCARGGQARYRQRMRDRAVARFLAEPDDDIPLPPAALRYLAAWGAWLKEPTLVLAERREKALKELMG